MNQNNKENLIDQIALSSGSKALLPENHVTNVAPDPFDPASLRLNPENSGVSVRKVITSIQCRKPGKQEFVRARPGEEWRLDTLLLEDQGKIHNNNYMVSSELHNTLIQDGFNARLVLAVTRHGDPFLWLLKLPGSNGRSNSWNDSALLVAQEAETKWIKMTSNINAKCYNAFTATGINLEPQWPELEFKEILQIAFKDRFIDSLDHPFLKRLRGDV